MLVAGIDGCRVGWIAVLLDADGFRSAVLAEKFDQLPDALAGCAAIAVDMPIGIPADRHRLVDKALRSFLGRRASTAFITPPRPALVAPTHEAASRVSRSLVGKGISVQAYRLAPKILEVEPIAAADERIIEVHPEASFLQLARTEDQTVDSLPTKKSWRGLIFRLNLLSRHGIQVPTDIGAAGRTGPDDVLDAAVAAWTASRKARGTAFTIPTEPELIGGRPAAVWV